MRGEEKEFLHVQRRGFLNTPYLKKKHARTHHLVYILKKYETILFKTHLRVIF
jgi:hypothetical protein